MSSSSIASDTSYGHDNSFTESQSMAMSIGSRIAASISFLCAVYMVFRCYLNRGRVFHRLMLGLSLHLMLSCIWNLWGTAAVPAPKDGESNVVWGARGTIQTCSAQGFFIQVSQAVPFYYAFLSLYSFQAVRNNFHVKKYRRTELWIHLFVHVFPISSAIYLLTIEAFNPTDHFNCWINSVPIGCGEDSGITCERGPQNIEHVAWIFAALPAMVILLIPTICMILLVIYVTKRQAQDAMDYGTVAKQAGLYLLGLYWTYIFTMINNGIQWRSDNMYFPLALLDVVNVNLVGVWILLVYRYFADSSPKTSSELSLKELTKNPAVENMTATMEMSAEVRNSLGLSESGAPVSRRRTSSSARQDVSPESSGSLSFNIFDGTNPSEANAQYIFAGDDADLAEDAEQSKYWSDIQDHI